MVSHFLFVRCLNQVMHHWFIGYYSYTNNFVMPLRTSLAKGTALHTVLLNETLKVEFCFKIWVKKYWEPLQQEASTCCAVAKHYLTREIIREEFATARSWGGAATQGRGGWRRHPVTHVSRVKCVSRGGSWQYHMSIDTHTHAIV